MLAPSLSLAGRLRRVNAAGDGWIDIPGHIVSATTPATAGLFEGLLWYDTTNEQLKVYDGSAFVDCGRHWRRRRFHATERAQQPLGLRLATAETGISALPTASGTKRSTRPGMDDSRHLSYPMPTLLATSTSADEGTGVAASREDHIHVGLALGSQQPEDTGNAADTGARGFASREDHVHAVGFGTGNVESVGTANSAGTNPHPSRRDHVHDGGTAGGGPDLYDSIPPSIGH